MLQKLKAFLKKEIVFVVVLLCTCISFLPVRPTLETFRSIDWKVIGTLFCLMAVVNSFRQISIFEFIAESLLKKVHSVRAIAFVLVVLCFFSSMIITNDVALLTFVPFTFVVLNLCGQTKNSIFIVVLETLAANMGSMATPLGNPQNIYLHSFFSITAGDFFKTTAPLALFNFLLLMSSLMFLKNEKTFVNFEEKRKVPKPAKTILYLSLFVLVALAVFHLIPMQAACIATLAVLLLSERKALAKVDYVLLLTFVCFFIFVDTIGKISFIKDLVAKIFAGKEVLVSVLASQVISNVPAAVLLSGFTQNSSFLLLGVSIGGCGTLVASLASLISYKLFVQENQNCRGRYLAHFTLMNTIFLLANYAFAVLWYGAR